VVVIHVERCTGCSTCLDVCPESALYLVEDKAAVDEARCSECEICVPACPEEAILPVVEIQEPERAPAEAQPAPLPVPLPEPEVVHLASRQEPSQTPLWTSVAPAVGSALTVVGRQVIARLVPHLLDLLEGRLSPAAREPRTQQGSGRGTPQGAGRRQRHRRRGA
jgi:Fe-S-cluster-containing hydrogenase component 2